MPGGLRLTTLNLNCTSFKMTQYHQMQASAILANLCEFRFRYSRYSAMKSIKWCYLDSVSSPPSRYGYRNILIGISREDIITSSPCIHIQKLLNLQFLNTEIRILVCQWADPLIHTAVRIVLTSVLQTVVTLIIYLSKFCGKLMLMHNRLLSSQHRALNCAQLC